MNYHFFSWICYCFLPPFWSTATQSQFKWLGQTPHNVKVIFLTFFSPLQLTYWEERMEMTWENVKGIEMLLLHPCLSYCFRHWCWKNVQAAFSFHSQMLYARETIKGRTSSSLIVSHSRILFVCIYICIYINFLSYT